MVAASLTAVPQVEKAARVRGVDAARRNHVALPGSLTVSRHQANPESARHIFVARRTCAVKHTVHTVLLNRSAPPREREASDTESHYGVVRGPDRADRNRTTGVRGVHDVAVAGVETDVTGHDDEVAWHRTRNRDGLAAGGLA